MGSHILFKSGTEGEEEISFSFIFILFSLTFIPTQSEVKLKDIGTKSPCS
jgi:hypothetical protein